MPLIARVRREVGERLDVLIAHRTVSSTFAIPSGVRVTDEELRLAVRTTTDAVSFLASRYIHAGDEPRAAFAQARKEAADFNAEFFPNLVKDG